MAFPIHADRNPDGVEHCGERRADELRTLVGIEDLECAIASQGRLERFDAKLCCKRFR